ncbi:Cytochrome P450 71B11 [Raphanus sativus]|nr:Cytochrome P450 71B11 [Raphanus sativus]
MDLRTYMLRPAYILTQIQALPFIREVRKVAVVELFTGKRVQSFRSSREEEVASFVDYINQSALSENLVNFNQKLMKLSGSVICRVAFGINLKGSKLEHSYEEVVQGTMEVLGSFAAADYFPVIGRFIDRITGLHSKCEKVFKAMDAFFDQSIKHHLEDESLKDDIIALLLKMEREETGLGEFQFTRNHTKGILLDILIGGIDTSANAVTWVMTHLIANPRVMKKMQAEVREVIKNKDNIIEEDIEQLEYLKMSTYGLFTGTQTFWKDPEVFIPERFMDKEIDYKGINFELLPFGSGRRMCPGMGLGMSLVHLTLINLLYRFDWKLPEGMEAKDVDLEESYGLVSPKKIPLELIPVITQWT